MSGVRHGLAGRHSLVLLSAVFVAFVALSAGPLADPAPAQAGVAETMESQLLGWINDARAKKRLPALRTTAKLTDLAGDRARRMAETGEMKHTKCLTCKLNKRGIGWNTCGEVIAYTTWPWGTQAAQTIFNGWKGSTTHWNVLMSPNFDYIGLGVAYRSSGHKTFAAGILVG